MALPPTLLQAELHPGVEREIRIPLGEPEELGGGDLHRAGLLSLVVARGQLHQTPRGAVAEDTHWLNPLQPGFISGEPLLLPLGAQRSQRAHQVLAPNHKVLGACGEKKNKEGVRDRALKTIPAASASTRATPQGRAGGA